MKILTRLMGKARLMLSQRNDTSIVIQPTFFFDWQQPVNRYSIYSLYNLFFAYMCLKELRSFAFGAGAATFPTIQFDHLYIISRVLEFLTVLVVSESFSTCS
jgi:hypothetical protein